MIHVVSRTFVPAVGTVRGRWRGCLVLYDSKLDDVVRGVHEDVAAVNMEAPRSPVFDAVPRGPNTTTETTAYVAVISHILRWWNFTAACAKWQESQQAERHQGDQRPHDRANAQALVGWSRRAKWRPSRSL